MASIRSFGKWTVDHQICPQHTTIQAKQAVVSIPISRRAAAILISSLPFSVISLPKCSEARERRNKKAIPLEDYHTTSDGLKYYDIVEGKGPVAQKGSTVQVHFDCIFRGITAVSSRESKLLAGNRSIAEPYEFKVGGPPGKERKREFVDNQNGLFSAQAAPKPPPAMYSVTEGMKVGGKVKTSSKFLMALYAQSMLHIRIHRPIVLLFRHHFLISLQRTVIVPPEAGYDKKRMNEIPVKP
ncbi:peptidyl-prolyl cis-trans isomerase FKBP18 [Citrus sinensis]|uniref:Peptidyl-prolyl cis-trans isomerase FKBP18 n=1 Tax=Citrus sinensis TaxID=2711 RepID=A0ACB8KZ50_CITSI|nr:peptidyl-prolyl cis-trans isomerase FKBP18 [Citrus sinensis]